MRVRVAWLFAVGLALAVEGTAHADARSKARRYFEEGMRLVEAEDYEGAIRSLTLANATLPHPDVQYNLARACADAGRFEEAIKWFEVYLDQPTPPPDQKEVEAAIATLRSRLQAPLRIPEPPGEPKREPEPPEPPGPTPGADTAQADATTLRRAAKDLRPLSKERAEELEAIAGRIKALAEWAAREKARPQEPPPPPPEQPPAQPKQEPAPAVKLELKDQNLREVEAYQEQEVITAVTREQAKLADAPGVVWIITQKEIRERGYETVAEALKNVAGLHLIDDQVFVDVGVRGVHAGFRGQSRIIKVLIDGHPVSFRPTSGNFLGMEMIPIRAVERIELLRGPASALYGANAFLGVLQVITRRGGDIRGGAIAGRFGVTTSTEDAAGGKVPYASGSADVVFGTQAGGVSVLLAAQIGNLNRSGLRVPQTSPLGAPLTMATGGVSSGDTASPISFFGSLEYRLPRYGTISLTGGLQRLSSAAEWLDYGALTHYSRFVYFNAWARLAYDYQITRAVGLNLFTSYAEAGPGDKHRIRFLRAGATAADPTIHQREEFGSRDIYSGAEVRWEIDPKLDVRAGADLDVDIEDLQSAYLVFDADVGARRPGDTIPVPDAQQGDQSFVNTGGYLQLSAHPAAWLDLLGGLRLDYNSLYNAAVSGRLGSVFRLPESFFLKALYGSSYRAPAPDQLFHGGAYLGDTIGCENYAPCRSVRLAPQIAHTGELVLGWTYEEAVTAQLTGYVSFVDDLIISFPNQGSFFVTTNAGSYLSKGLELEVEGRLVRATSWLDVGAHAQLSVQDTTPDIPASQFMPAESIRDEFRAASLFPSVSGGGGIDLYSAPAHLGLYVEARVVGARRPSGSNLVLSAMSYEGGELPPYVELDANLSTRDLTLFGDAETVLSLRVTDLIGAKHAEGGFRGWDVPAIGRVVFFRVIQEF